MIFFPKWDSYKVVEKIGEGGMANVYKAFDPKLKRFVALKFLKIDSSEMKQRFAQEAQSQARLTHDNICQIYEVGEYNGTSYIAMQYIPGKPFLNSIRELNNEQKIGIMITVCNAIHEAHRKGIIHRDIKPQNIIIEKGPDGTGTPYIMDFGLAKTIESPSSTISGTIIGTPNYMSPEQVYGEKDKIDRRSDVYCIGSTMYEVFTGKNCFEEESPFKVLKKLVNHDFPPPHKYNPSIPTDIETIILKSMEKDPNRRYNSAKELSEDLQRFLNGEPLQAKPTGLIYKLVKKAKKHKTAVFSGGIFLLIALFFLGMWINSSLDKKKIARISQMFIQEIEQTENLHQLSNTIPLHDTRNIKKQITTRLKEIEQRIKKIGKLAKGPGHYALGRGYQILNKNKIALKYLQNSWTNGFKNKNISYSFGIVLGRLFEEEREIALKIPVESKREQKLKKIKQKYLEPALEQLKKSTGIIGKSTEYINGLISFYENNHKKALEYSKQAFDKNPWLYDAKILQGSIIYSQAKKKVHEGKTKEALALLTQAQNIYVEAARTGESDYKPYLSLCHIWLQVIDLYLYETGQDFYPVMQKCLEALNKVEQIDQDNNLIYTIRGRLYSTYGEYLIEKGKDAGKAFEEGIKNCKHSIRLNPKDSDPYRTLSNIYIFQSYNLLYQGQNPIIPLEKAQKILNEAISLQPDSASNYMSLGVIFAYRIQHQMNNNQDPLNTIAQSIKTFKKVIQLQPSYTDAYVNLGGIYYLKADYEESIGINPIESINLSIASHRQCMKIKPSAFARTNLGLSLSKLTDFQIKIGENPDSSLNETEKVYSDLIMVKNNDFRGYNGIAEAYYSRAKWNFSHGKSPELLYNKSIENHKKSIQINPKYTHSYVQMANCFYALSQFHLHENRSPLKWIKTGLRHLTNADKITPGNSDLKLYKLTGILLLIKNQIMINQSPVNLIRQFNQINKTIKVNSSEYFLKKIIGHKYFLEGILKIKNNQNPIPFFDQARKSFSTSLSLNPTSVDTLLIYSKSLYNKAQWLIKKNQPSNSIIKTGLQITEKILSINKNNASAILMKSRWLFLKSNIEQNSLKGTKYKSEAEVLNQKALTINRYLKNSLIY